MINYNKKCVLAYLSLLLILLSINFKSFGFQNLSSSEISNLQSQAKALGYSDSDMLKLAQQYGYLPANQNNTNVQANNQYSNDDDLVNKYLQFTKETQSDSLTYFGYNIFNREQSKLSFEVLQSTPIPEDYIIAPGDEISIQILGASEKNYISVVNTSGNLIFQNIGLINVSGLTLEKATAKIKKQFSIIYTELYSDNGRTSIQVTVSKVRSIKVNLVGELNLPGTFTFNGLTTVFNAIYLAGGPTFLGTLRNIKVYRKNKLIATVDYYDFLLNGKTVDNVRLQNDDIILVGTYLNRVKIVGEIKKPGIYEIKDNETFNDLLNYAGGFTENAYKEQVKVERKTEKEKLVSDIFSSQFQLFTLKNGDELQVNKILDRFQNRVIIKGAVFRPGVFSITEGLTITQLIERADGLRGDAFFNRALLLRNNELLGTESVTLNLKNILENKENDILLKPEDVVEILSIYDVSKERYVKISGAVNKEGTYRFAENMTVGDLIFLAQGLNPTAQPDKIEIYRRQTDANLQNVTQVIECGINKDLEIQESIMPLQPFDHIIVRKNPQHFKQKSVTILGEVTYPGTYPILNNDENILDVLNRAGMFTNQAYIKGASMIRTTEFFRNKNELDSEKQYLNEVLNSLDTMNLTESDKIFIQQIVQELKYSNNSEAYNSNLVTEAKKSRLEEIAYKNPFLNDLKIKRSESIPIYMEHILKNSNSKDNLKLEDGDIISIPKAQQTVRVRGRVIFPSSMNFEENKSVKYYIQKAGGFDLRAKKSYTYIIYANGEVSRTRKNIFLFNKYPKIEPGSEVIVPVKPPKIPIKPTELIGISSGLATLGLLITQIFK